MAVNFLEKISVALMQGREVLGRELVNAKGGGWWKAVVTSGALLAVYGPDARDAPFFDAPSDRPQRYAGNFLPLKRSIVPRSLFVGADGQQIKALVF